MKIVKHRNFYRFISDGSQIENDAINALLHELNTDQCGCYVDKGAENARNYVDVSRAGWDAECRRLAEEVA